jgi:hypothetical protein
VEYPHQEDNDSHASAEDGGNNSLDDPRDGEDRKFSVRDDDIDVEREYKENLRKHGLIVRWEWGAKTATTAKSTA